MESIKETTGIVNLHINNWPVQNIVDNNSSFIIIIDSPATVSVAALIGYDIIITTATDIGFTYSHL